MMINYGKIISGSNSLSIMYIAYSHHVVEKQTSDTCLKIINGTLWRLYFSFSKNNLYSRAIRGDSPLAVSFAGLRPPRSCRCLPFRISLTFLNHWKRSTWSFNET